MAAVNVGDVFGSFVAEGALVEASGHSPVALEASVLDAKVRLMQGLLIAESLKAGAVLDDLRLTVTKIWRGHAENTSDQPEVWTLLDFTAADDDAESLATAFAGALAAGPWYVSFNTADHAYVVYADNVFRYPRGDAASRAAAQEHGRSVGIPEPQLDWAD